MKFVADMPISHRTVSHLTAQGHDVYRVSERGMSRASDAEIVGLALNEQRVIRTMDLDFAAIIAKSSEKFPSAMIFRLENETPENVNSLLDRILPSIEPELESGAIVIVDQIRVRIRKLPI